MHAWLSCQCLREDWVGQFGCGSINPINRAPVDYYDSKLCHRTQPTPVLHAASREMATPGAPVGPVSWVPWYLLIKNSLTACMLSDEIPPVTVFWSE